MPKSKRPKKVDPFQKHFRKLNKEHLHGKIGGKRIHARTRRRLMRKIRKRNKPILELARSLHSRLRRFAKKRTPQICLLGVDERMARDTWNLAMQWAALYK